MIIKLGNKSHTQSFKQRVYASLEMPMSAQPLGKAIGLALIVLIVLNALLVGVPDRDLEGQFSSAIFIFSVFSTAVFALYRSGICKASPGNHCGVYGACIISGCFECIDV